MSRVYGKSCLVCLLWGGAWAFGSGAAACSSGLSSRSCGEIPGDGCPVERGGTCDDPSCDALYSCDDGQWVLVKTCPPDGTGGAGASGSGGSAAGGSAGGGWGGGGGSDCTPADIDHTGEASGCDPDLVEVPDCPVEAAESCHPCLTGCVDFFLCKAGGWELVAYCTEDGQVVVL